MTTHIPRDQYEAKRYADLCGKVSVGARFGNLTIVGEPFKTIDGGQSRVLVVTQCDCGKYGVDRATRLASGTRKGCGCHLRNNKPPNKTHGEAGKTKLNNVWRNVKERCNCTTTRAYKWYGAKGIKMYPAWEGDYTIFRDWANATGYKPGLHLDRIDPTKGYSPDNCQWLTPSANSKKNAMTMLRHVKPPKTASSTLCLSLSLQLFPRSKSNASPLCPFVSRSYRNARRSSSS